MSSLPTITLFDKRQLNEMVELFTQLQSQFRSESSRISGQQQDKINRFLNNFKHLFTDYLIVDDTYQHFDYFTVLSKYAKLLHIDCHQRISRSHFDGIYIVLKGTLEEIIYTPQPEPEEATPIIQPQQQQQQQQPQQPQLQSQPSNQTQNTAPSKFFFLQQQQAQQQLQHQQQQQYQQQQQSQLPQSATTIIEPSVLVRQRNQRMDHTRMTKMVNMIVSQNQENNKSLSPAESALPSPQSQANTPRLSISQSPHNTSYFNFGNFSDEVAQLDQSNPMLQSPQEDDQQNQDACLPSWMRERLSKSKSQLSTRQSKHLEAINENTPCAQHNEEDTYQSIMEEKSSRGSPSLPPRLRLMVPLHKQQGIISNNTQIQVKVNRLDRIDDVSIKECSSSVDLSFPHSSYSNLQSPEKKLEFAFDHNTLNFLATPATPVHLSKPYSPMASQKLCTSILSSSNLRVLPGYEYLPRTSQIFSARSSLKQASVYNSNPDPQQETRTIISKRLVFSSEALNLIGIDAKDRRYVVSAPKQLVEYLLNRQAKGEKNHLEKDTSKYNSVCLYISLKSMEKAFREQIEQLRFKKNALEKLFGEKVQATKIIKFAYQFLPRFYSKHQTIYQQGDLPPHSIYLVKTGTIALSEAPLVPIKPVVTVHEVDPFDELKKKTRTKPKQTGLPKEILSVLTESELFGIEEIQKGLQKRAMTATVSSNFAEVYVLSQEHFEKLSETDNGSLIEAWFNSKEAFHKQQRKLFSRIKINTQTNDPFAIDKKNSNKNTPKMNSCINISIDRAVLGRDQKAVPSIMNIDEFIQTQNQFMMPMDSSMEMISQPSLTSPIRSERCLTSKRDLLIHSEEQPYQLNTPKKFPSKRQIIYANSIKTPTNYQQDGSPSLTNYDFPRQQRTADYFYSRGGMSENVHKSERMIKSHWNDTNSPSGVKSIKGTISSTLLLSRKSSSPMRLLPTVTSQKQFDESTLNTAVSQLPRIRNNSEYQMNQPPNRSPQDRSSSREIYISTAGESSKQQIVYRVPKIHAQSTSQTSTPNKVKVFKRQQKVQDISEADRIARLQEVVRENTNLLHIRFTDSQLSSPIFRELSPTSLKQRGLLKNTSNNSSSDNNRSRSPQLSSRWKSPKSRKKNFDVNLTIRTSPKSEQYSVSHITVVQFSPSSNITNRTEEQTGKRSTQLSRIEQPDKALNQKPINYHMEIKRYLGSQKRISPRTLVKSPQGFLNSVDVSPKGKQFNTCYSSKQLLNSPSTTNLH